MPKSPKKLFEEIRSNPRGVRFSAFVRVVEAFGFQFERRSGSHQIFRHPDVPEHLNLQERGGEAKPYQVRQFLRLVEEYDLEIE